MQQKAFTLHNRGMNRDLSISKAGESSAYENHNIRILARDNDTMLSVTNERGNKEISLGSAIVGTLVGWNVLNNHVILFTTENNTDRIYRIDYNGSSFEVAYNKPLFTGNLGFKVDAPIESIVYFETEDIQKIYWLDGNHPLRFMNFMADEAEINSWNDGDNTHFDSNRPIEFTLSASISKDNSGNNRANGTVQYLLTYYSKHGQETGVAWVSDIVYLSPLDVGGSADGTNSNKVTIHFSDLDTRFSNFRVYSIFRSSLNGTTVAYIVGDGNTSGGSAIIVDDGAHLVTEDVSRLLYLGSQNLKAGTMTHKDQTLFLGDLKSTGSDYSEMDIAVESMFSDKSKGLSGAITFEYSGSNGMTDIPYEEDSGSYTYSSQLNLTSSEILSFKGGEKYRFALVFTTESGTNTKAFWIGDAVNYLYPVIDINGHVIKRIVAKCQLTQAVLSAMDSLGYKMVRLCIAEASYADRSVKAQGIVSPTMFNVWERYNSRLYSMPSWIFRPRNSSFAFSHFEPVHNSTGSDGEIQCNYWRNTDVPTPYYQTENGEYVDKFDGLVDYSNYMIIYGYNRNKTGSEYDAYVTILKASDSTSHNSFTMSDMAKVAATSGGNEYAELTDSIFAKTSGKLIGKGRNETSKRGAYNKVVAFLTDEGITDIVPWDTFSGWLSEGNSTTRHRVPNVPFDGSGYTTNYLEALNANGWNSIDAETSVTVGDYSASFYKKHLMFVDENVVTLNSPELEYEAVTFDNAENYKFRIVGIAKITSSQSDYVVDASHAALSGENLVSTSINSIDGLTSWPLWKERGLEFKTGDSGSDRPPHSSSEPDKWTEEDYKGYGAGSVRYWLHMWHKLGKIDGFTDENNNNYSDLHSKTFANMRFSYCTMYKNLVAGANNGYDYTPSSIRVFNSLTSQYTGLTVDGKNEYYDGNPNVSLSVPGSHSYPLLYSTGNQDTDGTITSESWYINSKEPVTINYLSRAHAVISLPTTSSGTYYNQTILPRLFDSETPSFPTASGDVSGALLSWDDITKDYAVSQSVFPRQFDSRTDTISDGEPYMLIGEVYYDFDNGTDTRYGGVSESAIESNRFIPAGPAYSRNEIVSNSIYANQGDTYFQRWDCMKTTPVSSEAANGVIDIASVMLETHINIDGRTDKLRGIKYLASIPTEEFGALNPVYSQKNNFFIQRDLDEDFNQDSYRSSITWTLDKTDSAEIDEWTHITLANSLKLDGDKGWCRALRRFNNSIIAFQDRGISEVLFNSRTQLTTTDGVPVEIANSGKVDGKRYITNKYGCTNKWSIVEGKAALYFVDNINKAFCSFGGQGIQSISSRLGFDAWFRRSNNIEPWTPEKFDNIVSYYDRIHSDVYLVTNKSEDEMPSLVYNETLGAFTSFFDYASVPMMTNVDDRFISFRDNKLWLQNEGLYCNFFGKQYDFWVNYRVTPDPFGDKIWTNIDYRADYYRVLDNSGNATVPESLMINGEFYDDMTGTYQESETFDSLRIWNEYQNTGEIALGKDYTTDKTTRRKFRIWHVAIPRAEKSDRNKWGLDRIRNPWINLLFKKKADNNNKDLMQLHDITVRYYE